MRMRELRSAQKQLLEFVAQFAPLLGRSERGHWCGMYVSGLLLDGDRKSIEPMAGRLPGGNEQALQQFVNQSPWEYALVFDKLAEVMLGRLNPGRGVLVLDDTSLPKKGGHSVGVARQYCGALGKVANCQSVVSWHFSCKQAHFPVNAELYLPREWTDDVPRMEKAGVPAGRRQFVEKWRLALMLLDRIKEKIAHEVLVFDAGYGEIRPFLAELDKRKEYFIGQIPESHGFWPSDVQTLETAGTFGRPRRYPVVANRNTKPLSATRWREFLLQDKRSWETIDLPLKKKKTVHAMAIRVREVTAQAYYRPGPERWLIMEKLSDDHMKYYVSNLPESVSLQQLLNWVHQRWTVEQGYQQLKEELGLDNFEGRSWRGLHHHMVLCFMAYCFLTLVKHKCKKKP